ncbi:hypothetical protein OBBRIDRAFT_839076 [Obba rivulosa]|uniref:Uncharacterized protein n=1 Tax=Obba rivulosa TaxID=1052685 RepID=A0A8E2AIU3_9APHY|nr:hypothetical protein OBBRIDRAFT_839076 [Obba rivulosa]
MKVETVRDAKSHTFSEKLYAVSELAQHVIKHKERKPSKAKKSKKQKQRRRGSAKLPLKTNGHDVPAPLQNSAEQASLSDEDKSAGPSGEEAGSNNEDEQKEAAEEDKPVKKLGALRYPYRGCYAILKQDRCE